MKVHPGDLIASRIVWVYPEGYDGNPIIQQAVQSLKDEGYDVAVVESRWSPRRLPRIMRSLLLGLHFLQKTVRMRPAMYFCSSPHMLLVGALAKALTGCQLVYYPFELFGERKEKRSRRRRYLLVGLESAILRWWVDLLLTQNDCRAKIYRDERRSRVEPIIVHNYKERIEPVRDGSPSRLSAAPADAMLVVYEGVFIPGRCLDRLVMAFTLLPENIWLMLLGPQNDCLSELLQLARNAGIESRVRYAGYVEHGQLSNAISGADLGVIIYDGAFRNNRFCEPGKLSDYVLAGIPVIAPDFPTIAPVIEEHKIGALFDPDDPQSIASSIRTVLGRDHHELETHLSAASRTLIWETQEGTLCAAVGECLQASKP